MFHPRWFPWPHGHPLVLCAFLGPHTGMQQKHFLMLCLGKELEFLSRTWSCPRSASTETAMRWRMTSWDPRCMRDPWSEAHMLRTLAKQLLKVHPQCSLPLLNKRSAMLGISGKKVRFKCRPIWVWTLPLVLIYFAELWSKHFLDLSSPRTVKESDMTRLTKFSQELDTKYEEAHYR